MDRKNAKALIVALLAPLGVGAAAALLSPGMRDFYASGINRPPLSPPGWLFPVIWTLLYLAMGYASYLVWKRGDCIFRPTALLAYAVQLILHFFWPLFFFGLRAFALSFFWLLLLLTAALATLIYFFRCERRAGWWFSPYVVWLVFAAYLNLGVWILN
ncbi:MAG: tryptophan-rich sensory protein [Clostridia bacterium]|nr:tryptophan-rich sensory protein [Clostridia bacterium]